MDSGTINFSWKYESPVDMSQLIQHGSNIDGDLN